MQQFGWKRKEKCRTGNHGKPQESEGQNQQYRNPKWKRCMWQAGISAFLLSLGFTYYYLDKTVPDQLNIVAGEQEEMRFPLLFQSTLEMKGTEASEVSLGNPSNIPSNQIRISGNQPFQMLGTKEGSYQMEVRLFGLLKVKEVQVDVVDENYAIPCGTPVGIYLKSNGVLVIGTGTLTGADGMNVEPAYGVLRSGDYIEAINGKPLSKKEELIQAVNQSGSEKVTLDIRRGQEQMTVSMSPVEDEDGTYKLGAWVRDDTQGIGTMTYLDLNGRFGALGHGISDSDTGEVVEIQDGALYETQIMGIEKGSSGKPGVMSGVIYYGPGSQLGEIDANTETGIFGTAGEALRSRISSISEPIPIGYRQDVQIGPALLRSSVSGEVKDYQVEIRKVDYSTGHRTKSIVFEVVDQELLSLTGGVIQGMSGSPLIQDGKLIGAVTHVFVQDSTKGYGIFIENMLSH
ncbi:MAG: SpoIVB peptidase [Lachnospiraceae bacterium]|nr:SpoIVB peptidase [Lachnospiraceae bacterium]